ncbi:MAG TPA: ABC transporter ATP-binding protein [Planctomycetota bacterium]|nr:ABC transporter ATP-binding protein [Planctomycetota bacterium]
MSSRTEILEKAVHTEPEKVSIKGVSKEYSTGDGAGARRFFAVKDVSLSVYEGEFLCLVGPSGCGKSTLLNLIAGFEKPDEGQVLFEGNPVTGAGPDRLVLFQEHGLFPWLNVQQNVEFGLKCKGLSRSERREKAMHYLKMVHLQKFRHSYPFQLSGGMKQRTAIARALAVEPRMLLMDEPFSALDPRTRDILHVELQSLWLQTKKTIVFVTHSVEEAVRLADRIVIMASQPGRIRRVVPVSIPHPRDFFDPALVDLRSLILKELEEELDKLVKKEGDEDWHIEEGSISARGKKKNDLDVADGI